MINSQPLVPIIIPVYKGDNYLHQAIDSALYQTCSRVEVLVSNDASTDDGRTDLIALCYGHRISYFTQLNGGVASALNSGLRQMRDEWFAWLNHDDMFTPNRLTDDMQVVKNHLEARVIFCKIKIINSAGKTIRNITYTMNTFQIRVKRLPWVVSTCAP